MLQAAHFIGGPVVNRFQTAFENYLDVKHVIPCANGTDALQIALMALGLKPGDEVITPSFTYIATTEVIALLGLKPVFVDVDPETFCIDVNLIDGNGGKDIHPTRLIEECCRKVQFRYSPSLLLRMVGNQHFLLNWRQAIHLFWCIKCHFY